MRAFAVALLASLSLCSQADEPRRAGGEPAGSPRSDTTPRARRASAEPPRPDTTFQRASGEPADSFALKHGPPGEYELAHAVIETDVWPVGGKAIIAFYLHPIDQPTPPSAGDYREITGYAFLPESDRRYRRVPLGLIGHNGGDPAIRSVFFANADEDPGKELIVIATWHVMNALAGGTYYETYIYARPTTAQPDRFVYLEDVSEKVSGGCECEWPEERRSRKARFKTAADVRAELRRLGYG